MAVKSSFSIKDLENLSGIKAHTIRIWEKRYGMLQPERSDSNIRSYDIENLKKLLNVAILNESGVKVSHIAKYNDADLNTAVRELMIEKNNPAHAIHRFKLAMLNFDARLFDETYNQLLLQFSFREVFLNVFVKLLHDIGFLWITNSVSPAHEHFISSLIKQKLLLNMERIKNADVKASPTFVLFLPMDEIHELGIMYIQFELMLRGFNTVYLGSNTPIPVVQELQKVFDEIVFVSYFTVEPTQDRLKEYYNLFNEKILLKRNNDSFYIGGRRAGQVDAKRISERIHTGFELPDLINELGTLNGNPA